MSSRVLIVGGGVAALEAAIALRDMAGDQVDDRLPADPYRREGRLAIAPFGDPDLGQAELVDVPGECCLDVGAAQDEVVVAERPRVPAGKATDGGEGEPDGRTAASRIGRDEKAAQAQYDAETDNGRTAAQQARWDRDIAAQLVALAKFAR